MQATFSDYNVIKPVHWGNTDIQTISLHFVTKEVKMVPYIHNNLD